MKSKSYILVPLVAVLLLAAVGVPACRPAMPTAWRSLRLGMSQREVESALAGTTQEMIGGGGAETYQHRSSLLGTRCEWLLTVRYDTGIPNYGAKVVGASARFVHPGCLLLNTKPKKLL
jgi:hypothetical protein